MLKGLGDCRDEKHWQKMIEHKIFKKKHNLLIYIIVNMQ